MYNYRLAVNVPNPPEKAMEYKKIKPHKELEPFIHFYWELKGNELERQWERVFPDGCTGIVMNLGNTCLTDNGSVSMEFGKTYVVGAMTSFKDSLIDSDTYLLGVCLKPATFANFYTYASQNELVNDTVEFEKSKAFNSDKILDSPFNYLDDFFYGRIKSRNNQLQLVINDIHSTNGQISIHELSKRNFTTVRQLERNFKKLIGISPKEYSNIIRFQYALSLIKNSDKNRSLLEIAFKCGYYDHSHLTNAFKRNTGLSPSQL
ncbi:helix-turn-helix transcriptional regulator [Niabella beijingensis]|uniref:helix-turn-helix transcriptional regulator n=1 Tax=Niabella beijingensis TaxID=2872700 RepID=UPI001CBF7BF5|nr:helix-turn-helix transcriptional regulator [Niabella beijingensis]MBZ4188916.1 helix-turn-helix transcriptional regulator [Niabella beijingensis]